MTPNAKRGDLIIIHRTSSYVSISQGRQTSDDFVVGTVTNITRDGQPKKWQDVHGGAPRKLDDVFGLQAYYLHPAAEIDVDQALAVARQHTYPKSSTPMPYASLDEVKAALKDCLKDAR